jgi:hypothetical protein
LRFSRIEDKRQQKRREEKRREEKRREEKRREEMDIFRKIDDLKQKIARNEDRKLKATDPSERETLEKYIERTEATLNNLYQLAFQSAQSKFSPLIKFSFPCFLICFCFYSFLYFVH